MRATQEAPKIGEYSKYHQGTFYGDGVWGPSNADMAAAEATYLSSLGQSPKQDQKRRIDNSRVFALATPIPIVALAACSGDGSYLVSAPSAPSTTDSSQSKQIIQASTDKNAPKPSDPITLPTVTPYPISRKPEASATASPSASADPKKSADAKPSAYPMIKNPNDLPKDYERWKYPYAGLPMSLGINGDWGPINYGSALGTKERSQLRDLVLYGGQISFDKQGINPQFTSLQEYLNQEVIPGLKRQPEYGSQTGLPNGGIIQVYRSEVSSQFIAICYMRYKADGIFTATLVTNPKIANANEGRYIDEFRRVIAPSIIIG